MKTEYLGDVLQGRQVIGSLNVEDLPVGEHQFWFQVTSDGLGQPKNMPVSVFKGSQEGPKLMITAGIHGDELNGVLAAQQIIRDLVGKTLKGTVTIVPTVNLSGLLNHSRDFISSDPGSCPANLNRLFPGDAHGLAASDSSHLCGIAYSNTTRHLLLICIPKLVARYTHFMYLLTTELNNVWRWRG